MRRSVFFAVALAASIQLITTAADQLATGRNVNVHPGIGDPLVGDRFLQRQVEPKVVCTSTNPQHCVAMANDYRTVDETADSLTGLGEGVAKLRLDEAAKTHVAAVPDAWLGLYRTSNGENWLNGLVPGFPNDTSPLGTSQPWYGLAAASDAGLATDGVRVYGVGLFFNRGGMSMIGAFRLTDFNDESTHPIRWDAGLSRVIDKGTLGNGQFADLPSIVATPGEPCGNVYVAYTQFTGIPSGNSFIKLAKSSDCGNTWTKPKNIAGNVKKNQRVTLVVDPRAGTPATTGGGTLYAAWRSFSPDQIMMARSTDFGDTWSNPVVITSLSGPANLCTYDQPTVTVNDNANPDFQTARALAFPTFQVDANGQVFAAWTERVDAAGNPVSGAACQTTLQPKIVLTSSANGGFSWTTRHAIDMNTRCETVVGIGQAAGLDRAPAGGICPTGTLPRPSGPQIQPVLSHNAGKLMLMYSEGRGTLNASGWHSGRDTQMDVRAAQISAAGTPNSPAGTLLSTTQVSRYTYDLTNHIKSVDNAPGSPAYNRPYLPQYKGGTTPFKGDHDDLTPAETVVWASSAHYATPEEVPGARFFGMFGGDNRESLFPVIGLGNTGSLLGNWSNYVNPGSGAASSCNAGIRNSNDYIAYIGSRTEAFAHQTFKPTGTLQRTWPVTVRNHSDVARMYRFTLEQKLDVSASFDQFRDVDVIGNTDSDPSCALSEYPTCTAYRMILPRSSMTFTVFGTIPANNTAGAPIKVKVYEANISSNAVSNTLASIVRLNPNPNNPLQQLAGKFTDTKELHGPSVTGPTVNTYANPTSGNPTSGNPTSGNPTSGNPTSGNPTSGNPTSGNNGFGEYTDYRYSVHASTANTTSALSAFANIAHPEQVDGSHIVQMIITRTAKVPSLKVTQSGCPLSERAEDQVISIITVPAAGNLSAPTSGNPTSGNPTSGNPTSGNPTSGNPTSGNPTSGNQTFAVAPVSATPLTALPAAYRANALASTSARLVSMLAAAMGPDGTTVGTPDILEDTTVDVRFFHCTALGGCTVDGHHYDQETEATETVPKAPGAAADSLIGFTTITEAGDNNNGTISDQTVVGTGPDLTIVSGAPAPTNGSTFEPGDTINFPAWTEKNAGDKMANPNGTFFHGYYLSTDSVMTAADTLLVENQTNEQFPAGGVVTFIAGTAPVANGQAPGNYYFGILADSHNDISEIKEYNNFVSAPITIVANPTITTTSLPDGTSGQAYDQTLAMSGGIGPFAWSVVSGFLPPGLSLTSGTGKISGTPTASGTYGFTAQVVDSHGHSATRSLSIRIVGATLFVANTDVASAGLGGMRVNGGDNTPATGGGTLALSGVPTGSVTKALLYWNGPTNTVDPGFNASVTFNGNTVTGVNIGFASSNAWNGEGPFGGFTNTHSYRADVTSLVSGNGNYSLSNFTKSSGNQVADINGVSLIVFFNDGNPFNNNDIYLTDGNDSNMVSPFEPADWSTTVASVNNLGFGALLQLHVSDGQPATDGALSLNGTLIQGEGEIFAGASVPQSTTGAFPAWDIRSFDISGALATGVHDATLTAPDVSDALSVVVMMVIIPRQPLIIGHN